MVEAHRILKDIFGFDRFRPGQEEAVEALLAGRNVLTIMPTGSGKSLCFQVPALVIDGLTIVVSPLVALMQDQVEALRLAGVAADAINSARGRAENVAAWRRATAGETKLLYMAPERLMTERMLAALGELPVSLFAVDEAHCISQWGPSFRPEYADLYRLRELFPGIPIAALTATADAVTRDDIADRIAGLTDAFRPGRPRAVSDTQVAEVIERTLTSTPKDAPHWLTRSMAAATGLSHTTIRRIWTAFGLQLHRSETFKLSTDPLLVDKVHAIVGLYRAPPSRAIVLCVDEKSQIQALVRRTGGRHRRLHQDAQRKSQTLPMGQIRQRNPRIRRPLKTWSI